MTKEEQVKAIWEELENFLYAGDEATDSFSLEDLRRECPLLTAQVEGIKE